MDGRRKKQERITEADVKGLKYFDRLAPLLSRLGDVGASVIGLVTANCTSISIAC